MILFLPALHIYIFLVLLQVWRLQAALGQQSEITNYSRQEFERLQNVILSTLIVSFTVLVHCLKIINKGRSLLWETVHEWNLFVLCSFLAAMRAYFLIVLYRKKCYVEFALREILVSSCFHVGTVSFAGMII